jgi:hypothetical protein
VAHFGRNEWHILNRFTHPYSPINHFLYFCDIQKLFLAKVTYPTYGTILHQKISFATNKENG